MRRRPSPGGRRGPVCAGLLPAGLGPLPHAGARDRRAPHAALARGAPVWTLPRRAVSVADPDRPDQSRIAFYFADRPTREYIDGLIIGTQDLDIPPGEGAYTRHISMDVPVGFRLVDVMPHMHYAGSRARMVVTYPDGRKPGQPLRSAPAPRVGLAVGGGDGRVLAGRDPGRAAPAGQATRPGSTPIHAPCRPDGDGSSPAARAASVAATPMGSHGPLFGDFSGLPGGLPAKLLDGDDEPRDQQEHQ